MASNGIILLNLGNRNAADFQRLEVPDSYEKASGALTAGTYVTVYKWLYQGFLVAPSLCDAVDADDHINLVDRTNGGIISVYPDDTITLEGGSSPDDLIPLDVSSNGLYLPPEGKRGFSAVQVDVACPVVETPVLSGTASPNSTQGENEDLYVKYYEVIGSNHTYGIDSIYRKVNGVWEPYSDPVVSGAATRILTTSVGGTDAAVSIQNGIYEDGTFTPTGEAVNVLYSSATTPITFDQLVLHYSSTKWSAVALVDVISTEDDQEYQSGEEILNWLYTHSVDFVVYIPHV